MRLLICAIQFKGGSLQVVLSLINEFKKFPENEYHVIMSDMVSAQLNHHEFPVNFRFYNFPFTGSISVSKMFKRVKWLRSIETKIRPDCVITTSGPIYWRSKAPMLMGYNLPANIYLDSPYFKMMAASKRFKWWMKKVIQRYFFKREAEMFFVQTDDVNYRLRKYLHQDNVRTISNTYSDVFRNIVVYADKLPQRKSGEIRLLTVSTYYPHKNFEIIKSVITELRKRGIRNIRFILTIQTEFYSKIFGTDYKDEVINIGPVKSIECPSLYRECDVMFLPSLLECFSASYAEAMVRHKPILTTDLDFAHTVCGDAALYFSPVNPVDVVDKLEMLLHDRHLSETLIRNGEKRLSMFGTAEDRAREILVLCRQLI